MRNHHGVKSALFALAGLSLVIVGCGGSAQAPPAPTGQPVAPVAPAATADLSALPDPPALVVSGRLAKLSASLSMAHGWTKLPMPQAEQVTELLTSEAVGPIVDLDQPIDFAVSVTGHGAKIQALTAISAAVKDLDKVKASLLERYKLVPGDNGALLIQGLGKTQEKEEGEDGEDDPPANVDHEAVRTCELAPAFGDAPVRLVCGFTAKALTELGPWLVRTATRADSRADLHVDFRMKPLQPSIKEQRRLLTMVLGGALEGAGLSRLRDIVLAMGTDMVDFAGDLEGGSLDLTLSDAGAEAVETLKLPGAASALARIAVAHPERSGPAPAAFWQLPSDADVAFFTRGIDETQLIKGRELVLGAIADAFGEAGVTGADRKAIAECLGKLVSPAPIVYGNGIDGEGLARAAAAEKELTPASGRLEREEVKRRMVEELVGWHILELDEPSTRIASGLKELSTVFARPSVAAGYHSKLLDSVPPSLRSHPLTKDLALPAGTLHYVLEAHTLQRKAGAPPSQRPGKASPAAKKPLPPPKPLQVHILVVPDGQRTWVAFGGDEMVLAQRLATTLGSTGQKLSARSDLASLKTTSVGAAGFLTARGLPEAVHLGVLLFDGVTEGAMKDYDTAGQAPNRGRTAIVFSSTAQPGGPSAVSVLRMTLPKQAIEDVVAAVLAHDISD